MYMTRRGALVLLGAGRPLIGNSSALEPSLVKRHDEAVDRSLRLQITDPASRGYGNLPHLSQDHQDLGIYEEKEIRKTVMTLWRGADQNRVPVTAQREWAWLGQGRPLDG